MAKAQNNMNHLGTLGTGNHFIEVMWVWDVVLLLLMMGFVTVPALATFYRNFDLLSGILPFRCFFNFWLRQVTENSIGTAGKVALKCISKIAKFDGKS